MIMALAVGGTGCLKKKNSASAVKAIVDAEQIHAMGILPVKNYIGDLDNFQPNNGGQEYARDVAADMDFYAEIECLGTASISAGQWLNYLERYSLNGKLYVDSSRKLAFRVNSNTALDGTSPCRIVSNKLATLPVLLKSLSAPFEPGKVPTEPSYRLAQAFFLSLRGSYDPADPTAGASRLAFMPLIAMLKAHTASQAINGDAFVNDLMKLDIEFNPCITNNVGSRLNPQAQGWKQQNFACVPSKASPARFDYLPGAGATYETVRDMVGHEIDALSDQIYKPQGAALAGDVGDARTAFFDKLMDARSPVGIQDLNQSFPDRYDLFDIYTGQGLSLGGQCGGSFGAGGSCRGGNVVTYYGPNGQPARIPARPIVGASCPGTAGSVSSGGRGRLGAPLTVAAPVSGQERLRQQMASAQASQANWISGQYLDTRDRAALQDVANGKATRLPATAGSQFDGYRGSDGATTYVNRTSGETFVMRQGSLPGAGGAAGESVKVWSNGPHAGPALGADGKMDANYVGGYFKADSSNPTGQIMGVHSTGDTRFEFKENCTSGSCTVPCNPANNAEYSRLQAHVSSMPSGSAEQTATRALMQRVDRASGGCLGRNAPSGATPSSAGRLMLDDAGSDCPTAGADSAADPNKPADKPDANEGATAGSTAGTDPAKPAIDPANPAGSDPAATTGGATADKPATDKPAANPLSPADDQEVGQALNNSGAQNQSEIGGYQNQGGMIQQTQQDAQQVMQAPPAEQTPPSAQQQPPVDQGP